MRKKIATYHLKNWNMKWNGINDMKTRNKHLFIAYRQEDVQTYATGIYF